MVFREHGLMLFMGPKLRLAFIKMQADRELGRSYAGLRAFTEGLHVLGYLKQEDYERLCQKYEQGLNQPPTLNIQQLQTKSEQDKMSKKFSMVLDQWGAHTDMKWRANWIREAEVWKDKIPAAKMVWELNAT